MASIVRGSVKTPTSTGVYRSNLSPEALLDTPGPGMNTVHELFQTKLLHEDPDTELFGQRRVIRVVEEERHVVKKLPTGEEVTEVKKWKYFELSPYEWMTWREASRLISQYASGYRALGLAPGDRLTIYAETSRDWMLNALAAYRQSLVITTAYATLGEDGLTYSLKECEITTVFTNAELLPMIESAANNVTTLKNIVYNGIAPPTILEKFKQSHPHLKVLHLEELAVLGEQQAHDPVAPSKHDLAVIMYTSGSTGTPKGVMLTHQNIMSSVAGNAKFVESIFTAERKTFLAFLPLAHILELTTEFGHMFLGSRIGYGNVKTLTDASVRNCKGDIRELQPTCMIGVPAIWEGIRKAIESKIRASSPTVQTLFAAAFDMKWNLISLGMPWLAAPLDLLFFNRIKDQVGGKLIFAASAGASLPHSTQKFINVCIGPLINGYGMTETTATVAIQSKCSLFLIKHKTVDKGVEDTYNLGTIGAVTANCEVKLVNVDNTDYKVTNRPFSQGELLVRGPNVMKGYYKQEQLTRETITEDGWMKTGDIVEIDGTGQIRIIDRKKNLVKLSNGEYIALEKMETNYKVSRYVQNICVYADPLQQYAIAIVQPVEAQLRATCLELNLFPDDDVANLDMEAICARVELRNSVLLSLKEVAKSVGFNSAETVGNIILSPVEWTPTNSMLTAAMKLNRSEVYKKHRREIQTIYI
ncbi:long-chain fatty acid-CoA ligase [Entophlyctis sp. JEL0112]|nr:long-chain fatty acid-CoA ligase [Entophlyctis sp. JEL0112]